MPLDTAIKIDSLHKSFGAFKALDDVNIEVKTGEIFGFLGPNGAGKTTTIRCIMDYYRPDSGKITVLGKDSKNDGPEIKQSLGYLSADNQLYGNWTGRQHLDFILNVHGIKDTTQTIVKNLQLDLSKKAKDLSSGNKQKLAIVLAFSTNPKVIIMDEPTRGLDPILQIELYKMIQSHAKNGGTIFLSSHNLPEVQRICNRVAVIKNGKVAMTKSISELLEIKTHVITAVTKKRISKTEFNKKNVEIVHLSENQITIKVRGDIESTLDALEKYGLSDLEVTHANLEDIFMEYYDD